MKLEIIGYKLFKQFSCQNVTTRLNKFMAYRLIWRF